MINLSKSLPEIRTEHRIQMLTDVTLTPTPFTPCASVVFTLMQMVRPAQLCPGGDGVMKVWWWWWSRVDSFMILWVFDLVPYSLKLKTAPSVTHFIWMGSDVVTVLVFLQCDALLLVLCIHALFFFFYHCTIKEEAHFNSSPISAIHNKSSLCLFSGCRSHHIWTKRNCLLLQLLWAVSECRTREDV